MRKHRSPKPLLLAFAGTGTLIYTMYVDYSILTEAIGFVILAVATYLDYDLRRWAKVKGGKTTGQHRRDSLQITSTASAKRAEQI